MNKTSRGNTFVVIAVICSVIAICFHLYLYKHHVDLKIGAPGEGSICNVSEVLNCDKAASSKYAEVLGIPIALLGAFASGLLLMLIGIAQYNLSADVERTERYAFYLSAFIFLTSLVMGTISVFILKSGCPFCMGTYVLSLITVVCLWLAYKPTLSFFSGDVADLFTVQKWLLGMLVASIAVPALVNSMILDGYGYRQIREISESSLNDWKAAPITELDPTTGLVFQGSTEAAKVVVIEFADFLCSHCRHASPVLHAFVHNHNDVKLIYKPFPLDGVCNPAIPSKRDGKSCELAYAALCAEKLGQKGWEAHHFIFENQETNFATSMDQITENICKATGVDCPQMKLCMNSDEIHDIVKKTAAEGEKAKINGTPAIYLNNKLLPGGQILPVLENVYKNGGI